MARLSYHRDFAAVYICCVTPFALSISVKFWGLYMVWACFWGPVEFYLGLKVEQNKEKRTLKLSQPAYIEKKRINKSHLQDAKTAKFSTKVGFLYPNEKRSSAEDVKDHQEMLGSIKFAMIETRSDMAFASSMVNRCAQNPGRSHVEASLAVDKVSPDLHNFYGKDVFVCDGNGKPIWCPYCSKWKPDRAHHYREIRRCVRRMDHFCPWSVHFSAPHTTKVISLFLQCNSTGVFVKSKFK